MCVLKWCGVLYKALTWAEFRCKNVSCYILSRFIVFYSTLGGVEISKKSWMKTVTESEGGWLSIMFFRP